MGNLGRYVCVALPFLLTAASLIALLVATLAGVSNQGLYMFQVNTTNLTVPRSEIANLLNINTRSPIDIPDPSQLDPSKIGAAASSAAGALASAASGIPTTLPSGIPTSIPSGVPIPTGIPNPSQIGGAAAAAAGIVANGGSLSAKDLGLYDLYDVGLWGYCYTPQNGSRACTKAQFNWAEIDLAAQRDSVNNTITALTSVTGIKVTIPKEVNDAVTAFGTVTRWTEIVFVVALVALGVELFFGFFANCTRVLSCVTYLVALVATILVCAAAGLATAMSVIVVGIVESTNNVYGAHASFNTRFLAAVWVAAAFAIAAGFFWFFTICCCAPDHRPSRRRDRGSEGEKLVPTGAYQPIHEDHGYPAAYNPRQSVPQYGYVSNTPAPRRDLAYEPYSHTNV